VRFFLPILNSSMLDSIVGKTVQKDTFSRNNPSSLSESINSSSSLFAVSLYLFVWRQDIRMLRQYCLTAECNATLDGLDGENDRLSAMLVTRYGPFWTSVSGAVLYGGFALLSFFFLVSVIRFGLAKHQFMYTLMLTCIFVVSCLKLVYFAINVSGYYGWSISFMPFPSNIGPFVGIIAVSLLLYLEVTVFTMIVMLVVYLWIKAMHEE
jgi:hypothetical protein